MKMKSALALVLTCLSLSSVLALNPQKEYKMRPEKFGMNFKEEKIATKDGASLNSWYFANPKPVPNYIIISGSGDGNMGDYLELIQQFVSAGYNVMAYDYRGYGSSSDFKIDPDVYIYSQFYTDLNAVMDHLRKTFSITKMDLWGLNIGAGISLGVAANRSETRKVIADGPWISLEKMKLKMKQKYSKDVIIPFNYDKNYEPVYGLAKNPVHLKGILVVITPNDELIGPLDVKGISGVTDTYIVKTSMSNKDNFSTDKNAYFEKVKAFLRN